MESLCPQTFLKGPQRSHKCQHTPGLLQHLQAEFYLEIKENVQTFHVEQRNEGQVTIMHTHFH